MSSSIRLLLVALVLVQALVVAGCGGAGARAPDAERAGWAESALGQEPDMSLVIRRDRTRADPAVGQLVEAVLALSQAASVCEADPIATAAVAEARELEMYSVEGAASAVGSMIIVLRDVPARIAIDESRLYRAEGRSGAARVYVQNRGAPALVLYVFDDRTWVFSSVPDKTARWMTDGAPPASQLEPESMVAARVSSAAIARSSTLSGAGREMARGLDAVTMFANAATAERVIAIGVRYHYESESDAERAEGSLRRTLESGRIAAETGLDPALVSKVLALFRIGRKGRVVHLGLEASSEMVADLGRRNELAR